MPQPTTETKAKSNTRHCALNHREDKTDNKTCAVVDAAPNCTLDRKGGQEKSQGSASAFSYTTASSDELFANLRKAGPT